jgi:hypothetical protein
MIVPNEGVWDFTDAADQAYARFAAAGAHRVRSDQSLEAWEGFLPAEEA